jgi:hypothetical protein
MTVATTANKITYSGNGSTTAFPFSFAFPGGLLPSQAAQLLEVIYVDPTGASTTAPFGPGLTQYQLSVNPPVSPNPTSVGGTVTYNPSGTPIPVGSTLTILRLLPDTQAVSLQNQGTLWQTVIEQSLDYLTMIIQQIINVGGKFITAPASDPDGLNYTLPAASARASQALIFDSQGNVGTGVLPASGVISSAMAPVVGAATLPAARTAMGLRALATEGMGGGLAADGANNARVFFDIVKLSVSSTIVAASYLQKIKATGPLTLNLSRGNTLFPGFGFWIEVTPQSTGPVTLAIDPADQFENLPSGTSVVAQPGSSAFINTDGLTNAIWYIELSRGAQATAPPVGSFSGGLSIDVTSNTTAACSVGSVVVSDGQNYFTTTPAGGINTAVVGPGGLDVGPLTANTFYNVWVIYGTLSGTSTWIMSLATTFAALRANLPVTYNAGALLGVLKTAPASTNLMGTKQRRTKVEYQVGLAATTALPLVISGSQGAPAVPTWVSQSLAGVVPANASSYDIVLLAPSMDSSVMAIAAPNGSYGANSSTTNPPPMMLAGSRTTGAGLGTNAPYSAMGTFLGAGPVFYASNAGVGSGIFIKGFDLNL